MPPLADLFSRDSGISLNAHRRWLQYPIEGTINTLFHGALSALPSTVVSAFGHCCADLGRWRYRNRVFAQRIARNYETLIPDPKAVEDSHERGLRRWWHNIGRTMAEFSKANHLWREGNIRLCGEDNLATAKACGGPLIFVSMHLGTWEAAFTAIHEGLAGPSIGPFQPEPNPFTNKIVYRLRKKRKQYLFPPGQRSAIRLHKLMCSGDTSMTIFIDEVRDDQIHLPAFGRPLPTRGNAVVAIKLANVCGGTLVPFYLKRTNGPQFDLNILPPLRLAEDNDKAYPLRGTLADLNDIFEPLVVQNLEHWYMLGELRLPAGFEADRDMRDRLLSLRSHS
ncbi:lysophospholipid acyltransferase family protein [Roseibium sp.]|uniref:lysophospholipid acyltransferase family protein n=1 Tax=Roseibium sp. TaxID=1936156 RepID=UPI003A9841F1